MISNRIFVTAFKSVFFSSRFIQYNSNETGHEKLTYNNLKCD